MSRDHDIGIEVCDQFINLLENWDHPEAKHVKEWVIKQRRAIEVISGNRERKKVRVGKALTTAPPPLLTVMGGTTPEVRNFLMEYATWYNGVRLEAVR